jgi:DNA-binding MarR family transcriptional regulator
MKIEQEIKQNKKFISNKEKALVNLLYTSNWYNTSSTGLLKDFEITVQQYNVLRILRGKFPNTTTCGEIKEVMLDKNPDLTRLVDRLVQKEFVVRSFNENNRRQVLVKISKKGLNLLSKLDPIIEKQTESTNITEKEAETLSNLLDKLRG